MEGAIGLVAAYFRSEKKGNYDRSWLLPFVNTNATHSNDAYS